MIQAVVRGRAGRIKAMDALLVQACKKHQAEVSSRLEEHGAEQTGKNGSEASKLAESSSGQSSLTRKVQVATSSASAEQEKDGSCRSALARPSASHRQGEQVVDGSDSENDPEASDCESNDSRHRKSLATWYGTTFAMPPEEETLEPGVRQESIPVAA
eukprot:2890084-Rhodomonas_salina.1